jgi:hypothetical protein
MRGLGRIAVIPRAQEVCKQRSGEGVDPPSSPAPTITSATKAFDGSDDMDDDDLPFANPTGTTAAPQHCSTAAR